MSKHVGVVKDKDEKVLSVGAFVEGELYLPWMQFFQARSCFNSFLLFAFSSCFSFYSRAN